MLLAFISMGFYGTSTSFSLTMILVSLSFLFDFAAPINLNDHDVNTIIEGGHSCYEGRLPRIRLGAHGDSTQILEPNNVQEI